MRIYTFLIAFLIAPPSILPYFSANITNVCSYASPNNLRKLNYMLNFVDETN